MAKGIQNPNWKKHILEWRASGKSCKAWCKENKIPATTLYGWKNRFNKVNKAASTKSEFIELKEPSVSEGIILEVGAVKIHLKAGFDQAALKQCLSCLRDTLC